MREGRSLPYFERAGMKPTLFIRDRVKRSVILSITFLIMVSVTALMPRVQSIAARFINEAQRPRGGHPQKTAKRPAPKSPSVTYTRFSHHTHVTQQKLACDSCHKFPTKNWNEVRKGSAAFPDVSDFPEHSACLTCHRAQFFARERPAPAICSNCHMNVTPRDTSRFLFPSLGDIATAGVKTRDCVSEFQVSFPHDKHLDVVSLNMPGNGLKARTGFIAVSWQQKKDQPTEPKSCPVCHQTYLPQGKSDEEYLTKPTKNLGDKFWLKKGTFKTIPNNHTTCFSCHNQDLGIAPAASDCNVCHKLKPAQASGISDFDPNLAEQMSIIDNRIIATWRHRFSSGTYRHEGGDHPSVSCLSCHQVGTMNTLEPRTLKVAVKTCGGAEGCHITATTDDGGILNYEMDQKKSNPNFVCSKCHISFGKSAVPLTHIQAVSAVKKS